MRDANPLKVLKCSNAAALGSRPCCRAVPKLPGCPEHWEQAPRHCWHHKRLNLKCKNSLPGAVKLPLQFYFKHDNIHSWMQLMNFCSCICCQGACSQILRDKSAGLARVQPAYVVYLELLIAVYELWQLLICSRLGQCSQCTILQTHADT